MTEERDLKTNHQKLSNLKNIEKKYFLKWGMSFLFQMTPPKPSSVTILWEDFIPRQLQREKRCMKRTEKGKFTDLNWSWLSETTEIDCKRAWGILWDDGNVLKLDCGLVDRSVSFTKNLWIERGEFYLCENYISINLVFWGICFCLFVLGKKRQHLLLVCSIQWLIVFLHTAGWMSEWTLKLLNVL